MEYSQHMRVGPVRQNLADEFDPRGFRPSRDGCRLLSRMRHRRGGRSVGAQFRAETGRRAEEACAVELAERRRRRATSGCRDGARRRVGARRRALPPRSEEASSAGRGRAARPAAGGRAQAAGFVVGSGAGRRRGAGRGQGAGRGAPLRKKIRVRKKKKKRERLTGGVHWWQMRPSLTVLSCHPTRIPNSFNQT